MRWPEKNPIQNDKSDKMCIFYVSWDFIYYIIQMMCAGYILWRYLYIIPLWIYVHNIKWLHYVNVTYISVIRDVILENKFFPWAQDEQSRCKVSGKNVNYLWKGNTNLIPYVQNVEIKKLTQHAKYIFFFLSSRCCRCS